MRRPGHTTHRCRFHGKSQEAWPIPGRIAGCLERGESTSGLMIDAMISIELTLRHLAIFAMESMEALLEYDTPALAIYSRNYYRNVIAGKIVNEEVNAIAKSWLVQLAPNATAMVEDGGAAGDTASVGVGFVNAAITVSTGNQKGSANSFLYSYAYLSDI